MLRPDPADFKEWQGHPVTEWVMAQCRKAAGQQKAKWAAKAWEGDNLDPLFLKEAQVRADCYLALPESSFEDWEAIDDSEA